MLAVFAFGVVILTAMAITTDTGHGHVSLTKENRLMDMASALQERRGISPQTCAEMGIVLKQDQIGFQYRTSDEGVAFTKWRKSNKSFRIDPTGARLSLFNLHNLPDGDLDTVIFTEGEFDAASFYEAGFHHVVSVPNGAPAKERHDDIIPMLDKAFAYMWTEDGVLLPQLQRAKRIIIATDDDEPGHVLFKELSYRLDPDKCWFVTFPEDCKDANEVLLRFGVEGVKRLVHEAEELRPSKLICPLDLPPTPRGDKWRSGWPKFDDNLNISSVGGLIVITGTPGSGKSQWSINWALNMSRLFKVRGTILTFEDKQHRLIDQLEHYEKGWDLGHCPKTGELKKGQWIRDHVMTALPPADSLERRNLPWLKDLMRDACVKWGCKWFIIDPWNEIESLFQKQENETQYLNRALSELKFEAERWGLNLIITAHPEKHSALNQGIDEMSLYSISGGAVWRNKADWGIIIAREKDSEGALTNWSTIKIDKVRDQHIYGSPGRNRLYYDVKRRLYVADAAGIVLNGAVSAESEPALSDTPF
jgi:twinkle protein